MEYPEGQLSQQMESDAIPTTSMSETISFQDPQVVVDSRTETADVHSTEIASDQVTSTFDDHGAQGDAQGAARPPLENLMERQGKWLYVPPRPPKY